MTQLTLGKLCESTGGTLLAPAIMTTTVSDTAIGRVVIDSRDVQVGDVFWALPGKHQDGARFAADAYQRGASGVVAANWYCVPPLDCWAVQVDDPRAALWSAAVCKRETFSGRVIAVTGSVGKSTTRHMIHTVLASAAPGTESPKNYNNHIGLPLSVLGLREEDRWAVFEMGLSACGEIRRLAGLCRPEVGVVTSAADAHLGALGGKGNSIHEKTGWLDLLPAEGLAVLACDDDNLRRAAISCRAAVTWVGRRGDCDVYPSHVSYGGGNLRFRVQGQPFRLRVWGRQHLTAALSALVVGRWMGLDDQSIARALAGHEPLPMRCEVAYVQGVTIVNDAYSATPAATRAALDLLREVDVPGRRIVVCGDLRELGTDSAKLHREIGEAVVTRCGADFLVACGEHAEEVVRGALAAGMHATQTFDCRTPREAAHRVRGLVASGDAVLVKGSRALRMERVVEGLRATPLRRAA